eukprot:4865676-Pleurochrysis_carterae.AAC.1
MARTRGMLGEERESAGRMFDMKGAGLHAYEEDKEKSGVNLQEKSLVLGGQGGGGGGGAGGDGG